MSPANRPERWWQVAAAVLAAIVALPSIGLLIVDHTTHDALQQRARMANWQAASQLAASVEASVDRHREIAADAPQRPTLNLGAATGDARQIGASLRVFALDGGFCQVTVVLPSGVMTSAAATPSCQPDTAPAGAQTAGIATLDTQFDGDRALAGYQVIIPLAARGAAVLRATYAVADLFGALRAAPGGSTTVVDRSGTVLASTAFRPGTLVPGPAVRALVQRHRSGWVDTVAPSGGQAMLVSYEPVAGTTLGVTVGIPDAVAYQQANHLQRQLWFGYAGFMLVAVAVATATGLGLRRRDEALAAGARRARAIAEMSPDGIAVLDQDGHLVYANQSLTDIAGVTAPDEQLVGHLQAWSRRPEDARADGGPPATLTRPDGSVVPVETNSGPIDLDGMAGTVTVVRDLTERQRAATALAAAETSQRAILDTIPDGVILYTVGDDGIPVPVMANPAAMSLLGAALDGIRSWRSDPDLEVLDESGSPLPPEQMPVSQVLRTGEQVDDVVWGIRRGGDVTWLRASCRPLRDASGALTGVVASLVDVSSERARHAEVAAAHARYAALVEHGKDVISVCDADGVVQYLSPAFLRVFGVDPAAVIGHSALGGVHPDDRAPVHTAVTDMLATAGSVVHFQCRIRVGIGWKNFEMTCANRLDDPWVRGVVCNMRDITEQTQAAQRLVHQATHDPLTGLPNRVLLLDRLEQAARRGERRAVLYVDLDHFKRVNDTLGHAAGDELLAITAVRIEEALRPGDSVGRVGGDEFVVLADRVESSEAAFAVASRIRAAVTKPVTLGDRDVTVGCSIGIALAATQAPDVLLQEADTALYQAKERGRNRAELYDTAMRIRTQERLDAEGLLRQALDDDRLTVLYQPIVDLETGKPRGVEALARLRNTDGTIVGPDAFIGVAEDTGLIVPLGARILELACTQQVALLASGSPLRQMSVNLSGRQLAEPGLLDRIAVILAATGLPPGQLCLELTESSLIDASGATTEAIHDLKAMGVTLALDDFGTGWSSLAYLRRFPIDIIKIDRSFVAGLGVDADDTEVVRAVLGLARALGLSTVAEGVETEAQAELLRQLGCRYAQGFLYGRPMDPPSLVELCSPSAPEGTPALADAAALADTPA